MKIKTAVIRVVGDHVAMILDTEHGEVAIPGPALKAAVLAVCVPLVGAAVRSSEFPVDVFTVPGRPTDARTDLEIEDATQDPVILELARRWLIAGGDKIGTVPIPTDAEADAAQWELQGDRLVRVA